MTTIDSTSSAASLRRGLMADAGYITLLAGLCLVFFWRLLTPFGDQRMYMASGDYVNQFYPYQNFVASELHQGRIPLWDPYILAGHPTFADPQASTSYPIGLLIDYVLGGNGLTLYDVELRSIFHYILAAVFMYLLVKRLTGKRYAGLVSGMTFALGGYLLSYPGQQAPILESAAWLPLILLFVHRGLDGRKFGLADLSLAGAAEGLAILAGHPQTAMFLFYVGIAYIGHLANRNGRALRRMFVACACFALIAAATSAVEWVPALEFIPLSTRAHLSFAQAGHGFVFSSALGIILPNWRNEKSLYIGIAPLLLALLAASRRLPGSLFWSGAAVAAVLLSFGSRTPLFALLYTVVPGFALFQDQERIALVYVLATSVLAGFGLKEILSERMQRSVWTRAKSLSLPVACVSLASLVPFFTVEWQASTAFQPGLYGSMLSGYELMLVFIVVAVLLLASKSKMEPWNAVGVALVAFIVADLFVVNWDNNLVPASNEPTPSAVATMTYIKSQPGHFRVRLENDKVLPSNYPAMFGVAHLGGDTPIRVARVQRLLESANEYKLWQLFNVDYVVTRRQFGKGVQLVHNDGDLNTYKVSYGLPRAYAVTRYIVAANADEAYRLSVSPDNNPGDVAILERQPLQVAPATGGPRPEVEITEYSPQRIEIHTSGSVDAMLIVADAFYPGWKATIDGRPTGIYVADYALRAVELPKGEHLVEMLFDPQSYELGAAISLAGWLAVVIFAAVQLRRKAR